MDQGEEMAESLALDNSIVEKGLEIGVVSWSGRGGGGGGGCFGFGGGRWIRWQCVDGSGGGGSSRHLSAVEGDGESVERTRRRMAEVEAESRGRSERLVE